MLTAQIFDTRTNKLGEGPMWHPERQQLFWFDILSKQLRSQSESKQLEWQFDEHVSAAGWVDKETLLIASETALFRFNVETGSRQDVVPLEADNPVTRSNDGRADPWGGFWIGTMGKKAEQGAGAIYRFFNGQIERLYSQITIPNSICFSPDKSFAYFTDTPTRKIMRQTLDEKGWPKGAPEVFIDLNPEGLNPDGAVVDVQGYLWNAQWGASRVARYSPDGELDCVVSVDAKQPSCPAFGAGDYGTLFITTATENLLPPLQNNGKLFSVATQFSGQPEHRVFID